MKLFSSDKNSRVKNETFQVLLQVGCVVIIKRGFSSIHHSRLHVENRQLCPKIFSKNCLISLSGCQRPNVCFKSVAMLKRYLCLGDSMHLSVIQI